MKYTKQDTFKKTNIMQTHTLTECLRIFASTFILSILLLILVKVIIEFYNETKNKSKN